MKNSPFQFLEPFDKRDTEKYHGRDAKVNQLYNLLYRSNLVVLFGPSGSGKTSLIDCGLRKKLDPYEWIPIRVRRNKNFNHSIVMALQGILGAVESEDPKVLINDINKKYYVTPCLILDQFEELFVDKELKNRGREELVNGYQRELEKKELIRTIHQLTQINCKIIISIREEFLGDLDDFERYIPSIYEFKLRLQDPREEIVEEILTRSFQQFRINQFEVLSPGSGKIGDPITENVQKERKEEIKDALLTGSDMGKIHLPFLQIYLDRLYHKRFVEIYDTTLPDEFTSEFLEQHPIEFRSQDIRTFGDIESVLIEFIEEIDRDLVDELDDLVKYEHRNSVIKFLRVFTVRQGYKRPIRGEIKNGQYIILEEGVIKELNDVVWKDRSSNHDTSISRFIQKLMESRILKDDGKGSFELAHDIIARIIYDKQIDEDLFDYVREEFENSFKSYISREKDSKYLLGKDQVSKFRPDMRRIIGDDREKKKFWDRSVAKVERSTLRWAILILALLGVSALAFRAYSQGKIAEEQRIEADNLRQVAENASRSAVVERDLAFIAQENADCLREEAELQAELARIAERTAIEAQQLAEEERLRAEIEAEKARTAEDLARDEKERAELALLEATTAKALADSTARVAQRQREIADSLRLLAERSALITQSSVLAFESKVSSDPRDQKHKALQAYVLNRTYNKNEWNAELTESLLLSGLSQVSKELLNNEPEILDLVTIDGTIIYMTALGDIRRVDSGRANILRTMPRDFFFKRNSLEADPSSNNISFQDQEGTRYLMETGSYEEVGRDNTQTSNQKYQPGQGIDIRSTGIYLDGEVLLQLRGAESVFCASLSPNFRYLAAGTQKGRLYVIDLDSGRIFYSRQYHLVGSRISDLAFSPSGRYIATAGLDGEIKINQVSDLRDNPPLVLAHENWVNCIEFISEDRLVIGTSDGKIIEYPIDHNEIASSFCSDLVGPGLPPLQSEYTIADSLLVQYCQSIPSNE